MIEGQEGVTWDDWVALASACEEHGVEALFRSDHYISWFDESRHVLDAWATLAGLAARFGAQYTRYVDDLTFSGGPSLRNERSRFVALRAL